MKRISAAIILFVGLAVNVNAGPIPYPNAGTAIPASSAPTFASNGGDVVAYFYGSDAGFESQLGLLADGVQVGGYVFPNHSTAPGSSFNFGPIAAGMTLVFELKVLSQGYSVYSDPTKNLDGVTQVYSAAYLASSIPEIPVSGIYVGFEDRRADDPFNDLDYNDHQFVFSNVVASDPNVVASVPEPGSLTLLATGVLGIACMVFRKRK